MNLHKCTIDNISDLISIGRETYYDTFYAMNSAETMQKYLDEAFDQKKIESELKNPKSSFYLLYDGDSPAAYMKVNLPPAQSDLNDRDSLELERIYVKKEYKGRGFGRQLLEQAISIAKEEKCRYLWLGVWEKNEKALEFYTKMGFVKFGSHSFRMGDEIQNDFVMKITL